MSHAAAQASSALALVDCNNFYGSCERVFDAKIQTSPVVALSNNDGCIIARSNEAKQLGIGMGAPFFKARHLPQRKHLKGEYFEVGNKEVTFKWVRPDCDWKPTTIDEWSGSADALVFQITVVPKEPVYPDDDCLGNTGVCSFMGRQEGFGYTTGFNNHITALYYLPSEALSKAWKEKHKPCSQKQRQSPIKNGGN